MASRRVFFVSNTRLTVHRGDGAGLLEPFSFSADEEGFAEFARYVGRYPDEAASIVAGVVEEEFREAAIPHVLGRDRRALLRARAAKLFPEARYVHATRLGRARDGRRDDRVLFSAITRPGVLAPWLAPIARHAVPLAGICSPAALTGTMLKAIGAGGDHVLVVSLQSGGGLRQTCFRRGRLRLSRLAVMPDPVGGRVGAHVLTEIARTCRYLDSLRPESRRSGDRPSGGSRTEEDGSGGGGPEVFLLSHGGMLDELRREIGVESWRESGGDSWSGSGDAPRPEAGGRLRRTIHGDVQPGSVVRTQPGSSAQPRHESGGGFSSGFTLVDLADVARRLGMRRWGGEPEADRLFVHVLARHPAPNHYATPEETHRFTMLRARSGLKAASGLLSAGVCLFGGVAVLEGVVASGYARILAQQAEIYEDRYRKVQATLPPAPAEPAEIARVVSVASALRARRGDPVDLLARVSDALAAFPRVRVESVSWRMSGDSEAAVSADPPAGGAAGSKEPGRADGPPRRVEGAGSRGEGDEAARRDPGVLFQLALVSARIEPFDGDYRAAIDTVHRFADALGTRPGVEHVRVLALPLDLGSHRTLTGDAEAPAGAATFEIRVALRMAISDGTEA